MVPILPRNWGLVVETPYYLQVAPFPQKLFGHQVHPCWRRCYVLKGTQVWFPSPSPRVRSPGPLLASAFFRPSLVRLSFLPYPNPSASWWWGDYEAQPVRLPPGPRVEPSTDSPALALTLSCKT